MTNGDKKAYLSQYGSLDRQIDRLLEEKTQWQARATAVTPLYAVGSKGHGGDRVQGAIEKIMTLEEEINRAIDHLIDLRTEIETRIQTVEEDRLREVLRYRYIDGLTIEEIAARMHYDVRHIARLHNAALSGMSWQVIPTAC